jgi:hypothetical protein
MQLSSFLLYCIAGTYGEGRCGCARAIADLLNARVKIKAVDTAMAAYTRRRENGTEAANERIIQRIADKPSINHSGEETQVSQDLRERLSLQKKLTQGNSKHIRNRLRMMFGDVVTDLPLFKTPSTPRFNPINWIIELYSMHIVNSLQKNCWDVLQNYMGIWNPHHQKMEQQKTAIAFIIAFMKVKKQGQTLQRNTMNGRDWRALFAYAFELLVDDAGGHPMLTWTAVSLKKSLEVISWLANTSDSMTDFHIAIMDCVTHILDLTLDVLDPNHSARHGANDHFHVAIQHFASRMTETRIPFRISEEGVYEAHLKSYEKKWMQGCSMREMKEDLRRVVGLADIDTEGAIRFWGTKENPKDALQRPSLDSVLFLPCCFATAKQKRTIIRRCSTTIVGYPQEVYWSWASPSAEDKMLVKGGLFVKMQRAEVKADLTTICLCTGSISTPIRTCEWLKRGTIDDLVTSLKFVNMSTFVDNINLAGDSKTAQGVNRQHRHREEAKQLREMDNDVTTIRLEADRKRMHRKRRLARESIQLRPLDERYRSLMRDTKTFQSLYKSNSDKDDCEDTDRKLTQQDGKMLYDGLKTLAVAVDAKLQKVTSGRISHRYYDMMVAIDEATVNIEKLINVTLFEEQNDYFSAFQLKADEKEAADVKDSGTADTEVDMDIEMELDSNPDTVQVFAPPRTPIVERTRPRAKQTNMRTRSSRIRSRGRLSSRGTLMFAMTGETMRARPTQRPPMLRPQASIFDEPAPPQFVNKPRVRKRSIQHARTAPVARRRSKRYKTDGQRRVKRARDEALKKQRDLTISKIPEPFDGEVLMYMPPGSEHGPITNQLKRTEAWTVARRRYYNAKEAEITAACEQRMQTKM